MSISGRVSQRGTRGPILVFAYTDLAPGDDPATHEPASVGTIAPEGAFSLDMPPAASLTLVFLADGANDGVVDAGDPIAVLRNAALVDLQGGDQVLVGDAKIDFAAHRVDATVEIDRAAGDQPPQAAPPTS